MLNPTLTPPPRVWPGWLRALIVLLALAWLMGGLWWILQIRAHDAELVAHGGSTFVAESRVASSLWAVALVAYLAAICAALGLDLILRNFRGTLSPVIAFPVHFGLGLGVLGYLLFGLGLVEGGYRLWALIAVLLAGGVNVLRLHRYRPPEESELFERPAESPLWFFLVVMLTVVALAAALAPATSHDDLVYHLESPWHMLTRGQIDVPAWNLYAHFPNLLHHVSVPLIALDPTEAAPRLLTVMLGVLIAYCLYRIGGIWFSPRAGGVAGLLFLTTPVVLENWSTAGLDIAGAFFVTIATLVLVVAPMSRGRAHARLAGVFAGFALLCRITALPAVAGLLVLVWGRWYRFRKDAEDTIGLERSGLVPMVVAFCWPMVLLQVPFWLRAWSGWGNPVYPFLFGGSDWTPALTEGAVRWHQAMGMGHGLGDFLKAPWRLVARGGPNDYGRFAGVLQPWYLLLTPLVIGWPEHLRKVVLLSLMIVTGGIVWFALTQQARFLIPLLPWAALIGGLGFDALVRGFPRRTRPWVSGALGLLMAGTGIFLIVPRDLMRFSDNVAVAVTQSVEPRDHLRRHLDIYPALEWLNSWQSMGVNGVQLLWDNRGHYLEMPWRADAILEVPASLLRWKVMTTDEVLAELHAEGISHLLVRTDWREACFTEEGQKTVAITRDEHDRVWEPLRENHLHEAARIGVFVIYEVMYPDPG